MPFDKGKLKFYDKRRVPGKVPVRAQRKEISTTAKIHHRQTGTLFLRWGQGGTYETPPAAKAKHAPFTVTQGRPLGPRGRGKSGHR